MALAFDVLGWLALTAAGLVLAGNPDVMTRPHLAVLAGGLLAAAGLLWVTATAVTTIGADLPDQLRRAGGFAALAGLAAVVIPWTTGTKGMSPTLEQLGYALHLPVMIWYGAVGWQLIRCR